MALLLSIASLSGNVHMVIVDIGPMDGEKTLEQLAKALCF